MNSISGKRNILKFKFLNNELILGQKTAIMGVLNVTPDSFYDGGKYTTLETALMRAEKIIEQGADIIDVGGESTKPKSLGISEEDELKRVIPIVKEIKKRYSIPISVDTTKTSVAKAALNEGAAIINDISGLTFEPDMGKAVAEFGAGIVLMHTPSRPLDMQDNTGYESVVHEVADALRHSIDLAYEAGINHENIMIDPGIGFGKNTDHNLSIINNLNYFTSLDRPILIGTSRKSFIGKVLGTDVEERIDGTAASLAIAIHNGASVVRVHDIMFMTRVAKMVDSIMAAN